MTGWRRRGATGRLPGGRTRGGSDGHCETAQRRSTWPAGWRRNGFLTGSALLLVAASLPLFAPLAGAADTQTITFTSVAPGSASVAGATYTPTATATSGLTPVITVDAASSGVCSISAGVVSFQAAGTCTLDANQAGNVDFNAATQVQQSFSVGATAQTVAFTSGVPSSPTVGGTYNAAATGGASGNPVTFSIDATSTAGACTITGSAVSLTGTGTCVIDANQAASANYSAAPQVQQRFSIGAAVGPGPPPLPGSQAITFTSSVPSSPTVGGTYTVSATGGLSGNPVIFSIDATSTAGACTITGSTISLTGVGTCTLDVNQVGDADYSAAPQVQQSFSVLPGTPKITFTSSVPSSSTVGGPYTVSATGGATGNPVTFSIDATSTAGACTITGSTISLTGVGTCVIDANQAANAR